MINTLKEALERINELEAENKQLLSELEYYRNRNYGGRKKHNEAWMTAYNDFVVKYEGGMTIMEIVAESDISRKDNVKSFSNCKARMKQFEESRKQHKEECIWLH